MTMKKPARRKKPDWMPSATTFAGFEGEGEQPELFTSARPTVASDLATVLGLALFALATAWAVRHGSSRVPPVAKSVFVPTTTPMHEEASPNPRAAPRLVAEERTPIERLDTREDATSFDAIAARLVERDDDPTGALS
jgi:hypothetical protein